MLRIVSSNSEPKITQISMTRHALSQMEADQILLEAPDDALVPVDTNNMPYVEAQKELSEDSCAVLRRFSPGNYFKLSVSNFQAANEVPFLGFAIERMSPEEDIYVDGSTHVLDPSKSRLARPEIAVVPLLHVFNKQIAVEAKRVTALLARASGDDDVVSLAAEKEHIM